MSTQLETGEWTSPPQDIQLWHGQTVRVNPGDVIEFYRKSPVDYFFVSVAHKDNPNVHQST
jgi:hypothetical protein